MAMTLRLSNAETEALRQRARLESRSMQEAAHADLLNRILDEEVPRYAEALHRLGE